jgi:methionyl-tRNA formyltransferase
MKKDPPAIVFMGTPDFAVPCLLALHEARFRIPLVITQPDRPKGRGRKLAPTPVKRAAVELGYTVVQPASVRDEGVVETLESLAPDFIVVVAFGQILPRHILEIPTRCPLNVHASLLPKYRGPAPIQWALMRGERETGVTTMLMDSGVDTGDIFLQARTPIDSHDTADTLHTRLAHLGAELLVDTIRQVWNGTVFPHAQHHKEATYAPMLKKQDSRIDWEKRADEIHACIRAMTPWPGAYCYLGDRRLKIIAASPLMDADHRQRPGTVLEAFPDELRIACKLGALLITEVQGASGKRMETGAFLRGNPIEPGSRIT